jgi:phosphate transport system substrate-binding protein
VNRIGLLAVPFLVLAACVVKTVEPPPAAAPVAEAAALPAEAGGLYPVFPVDAKLAGRVTCEGSSAVGLILEAMKADFKEAQPDIAVEVISAGSGAAVEALAAGRCDLAPMSRPMKPDERAVIEKARGLPVQSIDIAIDAIAICVNVENPLTQISLRDLDRVFGRERKRGGEPAVRWSDLGVGPPVGSQSIVAVGMGPNSGSNGLVREVVLAGGSYRTTVIEEPVSSGVVQAIAADPAAIGYCSVFFAAERPAKAGAKARPTRIRMLALEALDGSGFVPPDDESIRAGRYPLARSLRIYFVDDPARPNPAARQLLRFLVSEDGQDILSQLGQKTLSPGQAQEMFRRVR